MSDIYGRWIGVDPKFVKVEWKIIPWKYKNTQYQPRHTSDK
jgi:hypothetical protein